MKGIAVPTGSRAAARVILINDFGQVLYLQASEGENGREFWIMPGGGLEAEETFEAAAVREVREETGLRVSLGPCVWQRRHVFKWMGRAHDQFELYFLSRVPGVVAVNGTPDDYVKGYRWWGLDELRISSEEFAPRRVVELLAPLLLGQYPSEPIDCGV